MDHLHWPLSVLSKAIHHKNLSAAADHIGLSQPQLSRLIAQLEEELGVVLLDRAARRKSGWTPVAFKVADVYFRNSRRLVASLQELQGDDQIHHVAFGTLEGLVPLAMQITQTLFRETKIPVIELNVYDLSDLEERFEKDELDLILTCREPGRAKRKHLREFGWQDFKSAGPANSDLKVLSPFEHAHLIQTGKRNASKRERDETAKSKMLLSNSLAVRRLYIESQGASGQLPGPVQKKRPGTSTEQPVYLIGTEILAPVLWEKLDGAKIKIPD
jgi:DNA-binding transcriptional LysR family regulator